MVRNLIAKLFFVMKKLGLRLKVSVLDCYLLKELLPAFCFYLLICTILGELIGISFEQIKFIVEQDLPLRIVFLVHLLKLPSFLATALPFALLIATISVYSRLSNRNEVAALQSFGVSLMRLILPSLAIAFFISIVMFAIGEAVVPPANYRAAMLLEREWRVDRTNLAKYNNRNIIYQEFEDKGDRQQRRLHKLFFAESFDGQKMQNVTLIEYQNSQIKQIIIAESAEWIEGEQWQFFFGSVDRLNSISVYSQANNFKSLSVTLTKNAIDYANNNRDDREMNILDLYRQLAIVRQTNNLEKIRQLETSIQSRYAISLSCTIFAFLGSTLGMSSKNRNRNNSLGIALIIIFAYYSAQFLCNSLVVTGAITVFWGVWFPNLLALSASCWITCINE